MVAETPETASPNDTARQRAARVLARFDACQATSAAVYTFQRDWTDSGFINPCPLERLSREDLSWNEAFPVSTTRHIEGIAS